MMHFTIVNFAKNITEWVAECTKEMDYWITAEDTPAKIIENFTSAVGRAPALTKDYLGFWQCKLRYRTQEEAQNLIDSGEIDYMLDEDGCEIDIDEEDQ